ALDRHALRARDDVVLISTHAHDIGLSWEGREARQGRFDAVIARRVAPWQSSSFAKFRGLANPSAPIAALALDRHALRARDDVVLLSTHAHDIGLSWKCREARQGRFDAVIARRIAPWQSSSFAKFRCPRQPVRPDSSPCALDRHALRARDDVVLLSTHAHDIGLSWEGREARQGRFDAVIARRVAPWQSSSFAKLRGLANPGAQIAALRTGSPRPAGSR
ncbi:hypothetical protein, partial [Rhodocyclus purpureus]|uniref:hypothetical protein n=1 Tax=Rhodocyclus purpureus TaxID=1067 RepID=UPI001A91DA33